MRKCIRRIRGIRGNRPIGPGFHAQADWAVIGVFFLELAHEALVVVVPLIGVAALIFIAFGGEE